MTESPCLRAGVFISNLHASQRDLEDFLRRCQLNENLFPTFLLGKVALTDDDVACESGRDTAFDLEVDGADDFPAGFLHPTVYVSESSAIHEA